MTARHLRESPRMIIAGGLAAVVLVLIGLLIGSATAGGSSTSSATPGLRQQAAREATQLQAARQMVAALRDQLAVADQRVSLIDGQLIATRARARCLRAAALHPARTRVLNCATPTTTKGR